jgi:hypothetical protein
MNILLIGYCNLSDGFLYASKALERYNHNIHFFPYLNYKMDNNNNYFNDFEEIIKEKNINMCLWWNNMISYDEINKMLNKNLINILFNWDPFLYNYEKYNTNNWIDRIENKKKIYPLMNYIFSCFEKEIIFFNNLPIYYNPPGFDKNASKYIKNDDYKCDVSFILTNLYNDNNEFPIDATNINRFDIVNKIYENRENIHFHIYGPEYFKDIYPDCYKGFIKYDDCYKVFSNSKINLSIHPIIYELNKEYSTQEYFSERVPQILGCKGLLMTNSNLNHCLKKYEDYIHIDKDIDYIDLIKNITNENNSEYYDKIRENGYNKALEHYTWDNWASIINDKLN